MELVIDGITKLIYHTYDGRKISDIRIDKRNGARAASYVFTFPSIDSTLDGWNRELEVYLCKFPDGSGRYELFVMGLHGVTCHYLERDEIKDMNSFHNHMISTMFKAKQYWLSV
jgi:hypothetical protein